MPGTKPAAALSAACRGSLSAGSEGMNDTVRSIVRTPLAARSSATVQSVASSAAPGREASIRMRNGNATERPSACAARRLAWSVPRTPENRVPRPLGALPFVGSGDPFVARARRPNSHGPTSANSAGTSVTHTSVTTSAESASAGPKTRKNCISPASSDAAPAATSSPAMNTSGAIRAVAARAATTRLSPSARRRRVSDMKNTV